MGTGSRLNCQTQWQDDCKDKIHSWLGEERPNVGGNKTKMAAALSMALCYLNVKKKSVSISGSSSNGASSSSNRVLVVSASPDDPKHYVSYMNVLFSAQKAEIGIDMLSLSREDRSNSFLKQLVALTGGYYWNLFEDGGGVGPEDIEINKIRASIWSALIGIFSLQDKQARDAFIPASRQGAGSIRDLDFRATCVCHGKIIYNGFTCPVCLSVYCQEPQSGSVCMKCGL